MKSFCKMVIGCLAVGVLGNVRSVAADEIRASQMTFHIEARSLKTALTQFGEQTGLQIMFSKEMVADLKTVGVVGSYTPESALKRLLADSGLEYEFINPRTVAIREKERTTGEQQQRGENRMQLARAGSGAAADVAKPEVKGEETSSKLEGDSEDKEQPQELVVTATATRLDRGRESIPTPMISLDQKALQEGARSNFIAALSDLPQFKSSFSPSLSGQTTYSGTWSLEARGLGPFRTLTLLDGRRLIGAYGRVDASIIPSILIDRLDMVTGSASAAWGSDAVAGVANIVLDNRPQGVRLGAQTAMSSRSDNKERRIEAAAGFGFANDRGHVVLGGEYFDTDGVGPKTARENTGRWAIVTNPTAGQAPFRYVSDSGSATQSYGGLITSGVNAGQTFNPNGTLRPFDFGTVAGGIAYGGEAPNNDDVSYLIPPGKRESIFGRVIYDLTDDVKVTADILHGREIDGTGSIPLALIADASTTTMSVDNAFLAPTIRNQMIAAGQTSFTLGRFNSDFARVDLDYSRETTQATLGIEGLLGSRWRWNAYYTRGRYAEGIGLHNARIAANFSRAVDAVISPTTGQPVCRVNVDAVTSNDDPACVPINLFGFGSPSAAAQAYVTGTAQQNFVQTLDAGSVALRGEPFDLPAGAIATAIGIEARRETLDQVSDPVSQARGFAILNRPTFKGNNTTREAFAEVQIPVVKDIPLLRRFELNGAARRTDDRTGSIWSWKLGAIDTLVDGVQLRFTTSRDIRAPNLNELFAQTTTGFVSVIDKLNGNTPLTGVRFIFGGNPNLEAEASRTTTAGITIIPPTIRSLRVSFDYFDIDIENAIGNVSAQQVIDLCGQGSSGACGAIVRDSSGTISSIAASSLNFVNIRKSGIDAEIDYALSTAGAGTWRISGIVAWTQGYKNNNSFIVNNLLGVRGTPTTAGNLSLHHEMGRFQSMLRARYFSAVRFTDPNQLNLHDNRIPAYTYCDAGVRYRFPVKGSDMQAYANVNNIFNKDPPITTFQGEGYDLVGRYFTAGVRVSF